MLYRPKRARWCGCGGKQMSRARSGFGGQVVWSRSRHQCATERVSNVYELWQGAGACEVSYFGGSYKQTLLQSSGRSILEPKEHITATDSE